MVCPKLTIKSQCLIPNKGAQCKASERQVSRNDVKQMFYDYYTILCNIIMTVRSLVSDEEKRIGLCLCSTNKGKGNILS